MRQHHGDRPLVHILGCTKMDKMRRLFNVFRREEVSQEQIADFSEGDRHA